MSEFTGSPRAAARESSDRPDFSRRAAAAPSPRLERVQQELRRIVEADFGLITRVNSHLFQMQGKMFRPTLLLLAEEATGSADRPSNDPQRRG